MHALSAHGSLRHLGRATRGVAALAIAAGMCTLAAGPAATATSAEPGAAAPPYGTIWVSNSGSNSLEEFAPGAAGNATPEVTISGPDTGLNTPTGVAIDSQGRVWVANLIGAEITAHGPQDTGDAPPALSIAGPRTKLDGPIGIAISPAGDVWVANRTDGAILEFAAGSYGNVAPIRTISGTRTQLDRTSGIALSPDGKHLWISEQTTSSDVGTPPALEEFSTAARGNVKPVARITGSKTQLDDVIGVAVNAANQPIADPAAGDPDSSLPTSLDTFATGARGNVSPIRTIVGTNAAFDAPDLLALDALGNEWIANAGGSLERFGPTQHGDVAPLQRIGGGNTDLDEPIGIAVFGTSPTSPRSVHSHHTKTTLHLTWKAPALSGGGILGYVVRSAHSPNGRWTTVATTAKRAFTKKHAKPGLFYDVEAFNDKGHSSATRAVRPKV